MNAPFAELVAATNFSFLRGASHPSDMALTALLLGHSGIGIADRNSVAGVVRAYAALKELREKLSDPPAGDDAALLAQLDAERAQSFKLVVGVRLVFADETPDIVVHPQNRNGWARLTRLLTTGKSSRQERRMPSLFRRSCTSRARSAADRHAFTQSDAPALDARASATILRRATSGSARPCRGAATTGGVSQD